MINSLPARQSKRVEEFLSKVQVGRGRLIFIVDATGSRQPTWDAACSLQAQMFQEAGKLGNLQIQLIYFRGLDECKVSRWTNNAAELSQLMSTIMCQTGETKIARALDYAKREHAREPVNAIIYIGDMCEEKPGAISDAAAGLGVPCFVFMEGYDQAAEPIFRELARLSKGAFERFDAGATGKLAELLRAVVVFAVGGLTALEGQKSDAARKLLTQIRGADHE